MKMLILILAFLSLDPAGAAQGHSDKSALLCLKSVADIRLPGNTTRFDYQSMDRKHGLLFISHLGDNSVTVFSLGSQRVVKNIPDIPTPYGILAVPELGRVFVSATRVNEIYVIDEKSLTVIGKTEGGYFPDGIGYAPRGERIFVSDEFGKTVMAIDARSLKPIRKILIGGTVGNTHYDPGSKAIFTTNETENELVKIDPTKLKVTGSIRLLGCRGAHGFVLGLRPHFAYVTGEDNASLVVVNLDTKRVIQTFSVGDDPDVLAIDYGLKLLYVSSESGVVSVFKIGTDGLTKFCEGELWAHAHTVSVDQETHRVYFPLQDIDGFPTLKIMYPSFPGHKNGRL